MSNRESWSIPSKMWAAKTVVIVAGGPSLNLQQVRHVALVRLKNECRVIAVNDAIYPCWFGDWLHACDGKWFIWHRDTATKFKGVKTTLTDTVPAEWGVNLLRTAPADEDGSTGGFPDEADMVAGGGNGVFQAIQIGAKAGGNRIILLGVDMKAAEVEGGKGRDAHKAHWFGDHEDLVRSDYAETMLPYFPTLVGPLKERGVEIINCSPGSALTCFPQARLTEVL